MDLSPRQLPPGAADTYRDYKQRQKILVTWLQQNGELLADRCAHDRDATNQRLSISDIEKLTIRVVARHVRIPNDILYAAQTLLSMRKEVGSYYSKDSTEDGHEWCIERFEHIVTKLSSLPRYPKSPERQKPTLISSRLKSGHANQFMSLPSVEMPGLGPNYEAFKSMSILRENLREASDRPSKESNDVALIGASDYVLKKAPQPVFESPLYDIQAASRYASMLCARAGRQRVPLHIAAYMTERALISNVTNWMHVVYTMFGYENVPADEEASNLMREMLLQFNKDMSVDFQNRYAAFDPETEFLQPFNVVCSIMSSFEVDQQQATSLHDRPGARVPYKEALPLPAATHESTEYYDMLLRDLLVETYIFHRMEFKKQMGAPAGRMNEFVDHLNPCGSRYFHASFANSLSLLKCTAQSFEYGHKGEQTPPEYGERSPQNCRWKALSFVQEVVKSLGDFMPEPHPRTSGYSTWHNLWRLKRSADAYLRDKRFDSITQHPLFAGTDILMFLDNIYRFGFQFLAYRNGFLGSLHVYNALRQLGVLTDDIPVLHIFCEKFVHAAFHGARPVNRFLKAWKLLDAEHNYARTNRHELKIIMAVEHGRPLPRCDSSDDNVRTERYQWMHKDSQYGHNIRLKAEDHSFFHKIFNQQNDVEVCISNDTMQHLAAPDLFNAATQLLSKNQPFFKLWCLANYFGKIQAGARQGRETQERTGIEAAFVALERLLVEEFSGPFPLISANLLKVWYHVHSVMSKMVAKARVDPDYGTGTCLREVLAECDKLAADLRQCGGDEAARAAVLHKDNMKKRYGLVRKWKKTFAKEFEGLVLADFQWKNL